jgi:predicted nucleotidyltransferase
MNSLSENFSSFNFKIFEVLIDESFSVRDLAKKVKCSPAKITQFIKAFKKKNLIKTINKKNMKLLEINKENIIAKQLISLIFINKIINSKAFNELKKQSISIGVYGSVAEGNMDKFSDIDLWVLTKEKIPLIKQSEIRRKLDNELNKEVSLKFLTKEEIKNLKENDEIYFNELNYKSKILWGNSLE